MYSVFLVNFGYTHSTYPTLESAIVVALELVQCSIFREGIQTSQGYLNGVCPVQQKKLIMSILNRVFRNFSKRKADWVLAASVLVLLSTSAFTGSEPWDNTPTYKINKEFRHNDNVTNKAVTYDNDILMYMII